MNPTVVQNRRYPGAFLPGALALCFYALHAAFTIWRDQPEHLLWSCHLASVWIGMGFLLGWPIFNAIGFLWLIVGVPVWVYYLIKGGEFFPTSLLTHIGGLLLGIWGVASLGMPIGAWWKAMFTFLVLQQISRWVTPTEANVNLAFPLWSNSAERSYPDSLWVFALACFNSLIFLGLEQLLHRWSPVPTSGHALVRVGEPLPTEGDRRQGPGVN